MTTLAVTRRPVVLAASAGASMLTDILARIARIRGRTSAWGVSDDATLAEYVGGYSTEAIFADDYYRSGFVEGAAPAILPDWTFSRSGAGTAEALDGSVVHFASGAPRITNKGLLVETARTNLLLWSQSFDDAVWVKSLYSVTANAAVAPDGTTTADQIVFAGGGGDPYAFQIFTLPAGDASASLWVKSDGTSQIPIQIVVDGASASFTPTGEWTRVMLVKTGSAGGSIGLALGPVGASPTAHSFYVWGAQASPGSAPTAYIPTTSATATRAEDRPRFAGSNEGTCIIEGVAPSDFDTGVLQALFSVCDTSGASSYAVAYFSSTGALVLGRKVPGHTALSALTTGNVATAGEAFKAAFSFGEGGTDRLCLNGGTVITGAGAAGPYSNPEARPGWWAGNPAGLNGYIRSAVTLPTRADSSLLQEMTS